MTALITKPDGMHFIHHSSKAAKKMLQKLLHSQLQCLGLRVTFSKLATMQCQWGPGWESMGGINVGRIKCVMLKYFILPMVQTVFIVIPQGKRRVLCISLTLDAFVIAEITNSSISANHKEAA
jgi:hypothetical protein